MGGARIAIAVLAGAIAAAGTGAEAETGDVKRGAVIWAQCKTCHMLGDGARHRIGPHLNELFGRRAASVDGFRYSDHMERAGADGLVWTAETLEVFLENPKSLVTGTRMRFGGLDDDRDRADLIAYLRSFSASPRDIPEAAPTAEPSPPAAPAELLALEGDPDYGEYLSGECTTCHRADGADEGIPSITGWPARDFAVAMHAYRAQHRPHPVMQMIAGRLSDDEIAALAAYFSGLR